MNLTPDQFLPPPLWRRLLLKYLLIPLGSLRIPFVKDAWHYWFIDYSDDHLWTYLAPGLYESYGLPANNDGEPLTHATTSERMWDESTGAYVRLLIELSVRNRLRKWKMPFEIRCTDGSKKLHFSVGFMCYHKDHTRRQPAATYGWTKEIKTTPDLERQVNDLRDAVELRNARQPVKLDSSKMTHLCLSAALAHFIR